MISKRQGCQAIPHQPYYSLSLPKMPTPNGVSWQTIFPIVICLLVVFSADQKKAVIAPKILILDAKIMQIYETPKFLAIFIWSHHLLFVFILLLHYNNKDSLSYDKIRDYFP